MVADSWRVDFNQIRTQDGLSDAPVHDTRTVVSLAHLPNGIEGTNWGKRKDRSGITIRAKFKQKTGRIGENC